MATQFTPTVWTYAPITKMQEDDDGSVRVYGRPTQEVLDVDHQIADKEWAKRALPDWFKTGANVREMHSAKAVGKGEKLEFDESDDPWLTARIIEPTAVKLVKEGVLQGFSIGIKDPIVKHDPKAKNGRITDGKIVEVSVVDRPAVPTAKVELMKMVGLGEYRDMQTGFTLKLSKVNGTDAPDLNPSDFDVAGNPVMQPGQPVDPIPEIITQDAHSVTYKDADGKIYRAPMDIDSNGNIVIGAAEEVPGTIPTDGATGVGKGGNPTETKAAWSAAFVDSLPDDSFAYISPGGKKEDGKTIPRSLRHLPYRDADGKPDPDHVRNALARLDQTDISDAAKEEARRKLETAAKEVGIDMQEDNKKSEMPDEQKAEEEAAMKATEGDKVLCQECKKNVRVDKAIEAHKMAGGTRVTAKGSCGHIVMKFVKSASLAADADVQKDDPSSDTSADENPEKKTQDDPLDQKFAAFKSEIADLLKSLVPSLAKDANPEDTAKEEETRKKRIADLRDLHGQLGSKIEEYAAEDLADAIGKGADPNGGPARVGGTDPKEIIKELKAIARRMADMVSDGEEQMGHTDAPGGDGHLGGDPVAPSSKPKGDGNIDFTAGDIKAAIATAIKDANANLVKMNTLDKAVVPDIAKAVGDAVRGVMEPIAQRLEKVEHMAQPSQVVFAADRSFALNAPDEQKKSAQSTIREQLNSLPPAERDQVLARAIQAGRGW